MKLNLQSLLENLKHVQYTGLILTCKTRFLLLVASYRELGVIKMKICKESSFSTQYFTHSLFSFPQ